MRIQDLDFPPGISDECELPPQKRDLYQMLCLLHDDPGIELGVVKEGGGLLVEQMNDRFPACFSHRLWHFDEERHLCLINNNT
jgi:hypothetical protein